MSDDDLAPDPLARASAELGEPDAVYAVSPARVRGKIALAVGLLLYGVAANVFWWVFGPAQFHHFVLVMLFGPPLWGVSILRHTARARGLHVLAYPTGLLRVRGDEIESYPWDEISETRVRAEKADVEIERDADGKLTACWLAVDPPLLKFWDAGVTIRRKDGTETTFTPALADYPDLAEQIQRGTFAARWAKLWKRFTAGDPLAFGKFDADLGGLRFGKSWVPWAEIKSFEVTKKKLTVKRVGGWTTWASVDLHDVPNPHLLLALIEEMLKPPAGGDEELEPA